MIIRIVKMTFEAGNVNDFLEIFSKAKSKIAGFDGCSDVQLLRDVQHPNIMFTYSTWKNPEALENYRQSELFASTWNKSKKLFCDKPEAWSVEHIL